MNSDVRLAIGIVALLVLTTTCLTYTRVRLRGTVATAAVRAAVQLIAVGLIIHGVFAAPGAAAAMLLVMLAVASRTATGRLARLPGAGRAVLIASAAGAALTLGVLFAVPVVPRSARYLIALGGIVLGGTMTACTLTGRRLLDGMHRRRDEIEGWLALGATPRQALDDITRTAVTEALVPALDQTRTVGLVTLPGAFVGALLAGASPIQAARFQLIVLVALLAAETFAAAILVWLLGAPRRIPTLE